MKKLLPCLLLLLNTAFAQSLGFNGAGFFENYDSDVEQYLIDMHQPFTLRVPGGAISKFHDPANVKKGWGMTEAGVKSWFEKTGFDEDGNGLDKWLRKTSDQPDHSYLDDLISLQKKFPDMTVLYVLNILNSTPEANMKAIRYLMQNGVKVVGVEAGNEVYGKYASFQEYANDFEPIFKQLEKEYPQIKKGIVAGANLQRKELLKWNNEIAAYKGDYDAVIMHFYYTQKELSEAYEMINLKSTSSTEFNSGLDKGYRKAAELMLSKKMFEEGIAYCHEKFPEKAIWVTEWNTKPSSVLNNTIVNGAWQFKTMVENRNQIEYLLVHNGVSPDIYGMITRKNKYDNVNEEMVRRVGYWAYILAAEVDNPIKITKEASIKLKADDDGEVCYYFTNLDEAYNMKIETGNYKIASITIHYLSGKYIYSSAGIAGYMGKGTKPSYEVNGIKVEEYKGTIPKNSFGYISVKLAK